MRATRVRSESQAGLRTGAYKVSRGVALQSLHVQLGQEIDDDRHSARGRRFSRLLKGSLRDRTQEVV